MNTPDPSTLTTWEALLEFIYDNGPQPCDTLPPRAMETLIRKRLAFAEGNADCSRYFLTLHPMGRYHIEDQRLIAKNRADRKTARPGKDPTE